MPGQSVVFNNHMICLSECQSLTFFSFLEPLISLQRINDIYRLKMRAYNYTKYSYFINLIRSKFMYAYYK